MAHATTNTRQKLIDTTRDLIWQSSYGSVSVDDICKAAGVKKGSFYHYFPSKVALAVETMDEVSKFLRVEYDRIFSSGKTATQRLDNFVSFTFDAQENAAKKYGHVCGCPLASLGSEMACQENGIREKYEEISRLHLQYYQSLVAGFAAEGAIDKDTDTTAMAQKLCSYVLGLMTKARIENDLEPLKKDFKSGLLQMLGLKEKKPAAA
ncbi:MAG: TetR/AcrR family transcriptional regulator [Alphaproteobacteria bacterium]|nr:TetR/AcrR family transcriptional regulator [Alphaproteobacteria bacterium]